MIAIFQTVKSKVIISLFETVRLSVSISLGNLYKSLNSIKKKCEYLYKNHRYITFEKHLYFRNGPVPGRPGFTWKIFLRGFFS